MGIIGDYLLLWIIQPFAMMDVNNNIVYLRQIVLVMSENVSSKYFHSIGGLVSSRFIAYSSCFGSYTVCRLNIILFLDIC